MCSRLEVYFQVGYRFSNSHQKGGADTAAFINTTMSVRDYVPRPHHEGAACINLRSRTRYLSFSATSRVSIFWYLYRRRTRHRTLIFFLAGGMFHYRTCLKEYKANHDLVPGDKDPKNIRCMSRTRTIPRTILRGIAL